MFKTARRHIKPKAPRPKQHLHYVLKRWFLVPKHAAQMCPTAALHRRHGASHRAAENTTARVSRVRRNEFRATCADNTSLHILYHTHTATRVWKNVRFSAAFVLAKHAEVLLVLAGNVDDARAPAAASAQRQQQAAAADSLLMQCQAAAVTKDDGVILQRLFVAAHCARVAVVCRKPGTPRHSEALGGDEGVTSCRSR
jgi:hypothetical protein